MVNTSSTSATTGVLKTLVITASAALPSLRWEVNGLLIYVNYQPVPNPAGYVIIQHTINTPGAGGDHNLNNFDFQWTPKSAGNYTLVIKSLGAINNDFSGEFGVMDTFTFFVTVTDPSGPFRPVDPPNPSNPTNSSLQSTLLTFPQAEYMAGLGYKIRRIGWADHYISFDGWLYWTQYFNSVTKVLTTSNVVQSSEFTALEFRAKDFTVDGIPGQTVPDSDMQAALSITYVYL